MKAEFQSQTFKMARCCLRGKVKEEDVGDAEADPAHAKVRTAASPLWEQSTQRNMRGAQDVHREKGNLTSSTGTPRSDGR